MGMAHRRHRYYRNGTTTGYLSEGNLGLSTVATTEQTGSQGYGRGVVGILLVAVGTILSILGIVGIRRDPVETWPIVLVLVGTVLIYRGLAESVRRRKKRRLVAVLQEKMAVLENQLLADVPIDHIATEYYESNTIPPIRTIQCAAHLVKQMADSDDEADHTAAARLASGEIVDSNMDPASAISQFSCWIRFIA